MENYKKSWTADEVNALINAIHHTNEFGGSMRTIAADIGVTEMQVRTFLKKTPAIKKMYKPKRLNNSFDAQKWPKKIDGFKLIPFAGSDR